MLKNVLGLTALWFFPMLVLAAAELQTINYFDPEKYVGRWYEIARLDVWFEKGCENVATDFKLEPDGSISSTKFCTLNEDHDALKVIHGRTRVVDHKTNAKLSSSYTPNWIAWLDPLLSSPVWVLKIDPNYQVILLGSPFFDYLWILSRTPHLNQATLDEYLKVAEDIGFDVKRLHKTIQDREI